MMVPLGSVMALMCAFAVKHFIADFLFQTAAIARGKAAEHGWQFPLAIHAAGHALITLAIALAFFPAAWWVAPIEFLVHATIDRAKVLVGRRLTLDPGMARFWWLSGFDQFLHQLTNLAIAAVMLATVAAR